MPYQGIIRLSRNKLKKIVTSFGVPGMSVCVTAGGREVWSQGFGFADVENSVRCTPNTTMRIGSTSKCFTAVLIAKLLEQNKICLDAPIQKYVPEFPKKLFGDEEESVTITPRMIMSHSSGIRYYRSKRALDDEMLLTKSYDSQLEAMEVFKEDPLLYKPGSKAEYSTHAWTILGALVEKLTGEDFELAANKLFSKLELNNTHCENHLKMIPRRSRQYRRQNGRLLHAPYIDNSWKMAGGGMLSSARDLARFGNIMLNSYQVREMWNMSVSGVQFVKDAYIGEWNGLGWSGYPERDSSTNRIIGHSGSAFAGSSVLCIIFDHNHELTYLEPPKCVVVSAVTNHAVDNLLPIGHDIAENFWRIYEKKLCLG